MRLDCASAIVPPPILLRLALHRWRCRVLALETRKTVEARPIVVITSNNEKERPEAFLRRCFFHYIRFPDADTMRAIIDVHFAGIKQRLVSEALKLFTKSASCEGGGLARASEPKAAVKPEHRAGISGDAVDAIAQSSGRRSVLEDMAQMPAAALAMHFRAWQQQQVVGGGADCVRQRPIEARPTGLAVVFGLRGEQRKIAARAGKRALALLVVERARAGGFGAAPPQHVVLRLGEDGSPFAVALLDFEAVGGLHRCSTASEAPRSAPAPPHPS